MAVAALLTVTSVIAAARANRFWLWIERFLLLVIGVACAAQEFVIGFWMASIRSQIGGPIDAQAADDPLRMRFDQLHQYSEWVLMAGIAAAVVTFFIVSNRVYSTFKAEAKADIYDFSKEFKV
jgi:hypothetical protein